MMRVVIFSLFIFIASCQTRSDRTTLSEVDSANHKLSINNKANVADSLILNFWNEFDFDDPVKATSSDYGEQHFVDFINIFPKVSKEVRLLSIDRFLNKLSHNIEVQKYFEELTEKYLYEANSPFYNEDYYILFLEKFISSNTVSNGSKERYKILLRIANKNRVGELATDFKFLANGKITNLYSLNHKYIILFFYDPGCQYCENAISTLKSNSGFSNILENNVAMLAIDPNGDRKIWKNYAENIPKYWINGLDPDKSILQKSLYDLKASPTIYLLDENKRVILKDTDLRQLLGHFGISEK